MSENVNIAIYHKTNILVASFKTLAQSAGAVEYTNCTSTEG